MIEDKALSNTKVIKDANGARYEIALPPIGEGGQGKVYSVKGGRHVVKILRAGSDARRERLRHCLNAVKLSPIEDLHLAKPIALLAPPKAGYVMEFLSGMTPIKSLAKPRKETNEIYEWYNSSGGLRRRLQLLGRTARLLARMHARGLVYSDPSPDNIFVSESPDHLEVWFIDTDNIRSVDTPGNGVHTPGYGAPELVSGKSPVSPYSDGYAFMVIAFEVLVLHHPFIGDQVEDGPPEMEEKAFSGQLPWIDCEDDTSNATERLGMPRELILSKSLKAAFNKTFEEGKQEPRKRPSLHNLSKIFFSAAEATLKCPGCKGTFFVNLKACPWCEMARQGFLRINIYLWNPEKGSDHGILKKPKGDKKVPVSLGSIRITEGESLELNSSHAFGTFDDDSVTPVVRLFFGGNQLEITSLDGKAYPLVSPDRKKKRDVGDDPVTVPVSLAEEGKTWRLHFGHIDESHRLFVFTRSEAVS
jgi:serine/threonine protein kinase